MVLHPFTIDVPDDALDDLRERLARTRWPEMVVGLGWEAGASLAYMRDLAAYWRSDYDWRIQENLLNTFAHYRTTIDGIAIHFIHARGRGPHPLPLILTHGWPSTFYEFHKVIPLLADPGAFGGDPADAFDVVVPSLPGYGFSDRQPIPGGTTRTPELWVRLMAEVLGYERFAAHGGDWGGMVTNRLGLLHPERLIGIHVTLAAKSAAQHPKINPETGEVESRQTEQERGNVRGTPDGYAHLQRTKPQSLAFGLDDSPVGLAAWILQRWREWSDCDGDLERSFTKDELLTNVMIYWVTRTIATSFRFYYDWQANTPMAPKGANSRRLDPRERVLVPTAFALFDGGPSRDEAAQVYDLRRYTVMPRGGHFPALEVPNLLVDDIRAFFRPLR